ncbi:MAG: mannose-6-phosphate isomerase, class I [Myxococcota bacterium]|nr:mannose-6-phosphate isomerase, class I [Myxococcota bacterium]
MPADRVGTDTPPSPVRVAPRFQNYAWGDTRFIPEFYGVESNGQPFAEAWLGAHAVFPSEAGSNGERKPLNELIEEDRTQWLGSEAARRFDGLPYLLKVLAAARPLSIQVHPSLSQATAGFQRENAAGVPIDAPHRCYRDVNHKPELVVALSRFYAVCGFRPESQIAAVLDGLPSVLAGLLPAFDSKPDWLRRLVTTYLTLPDELLLPALGAWIAELEAWPEALNRSHPEYWVLESHRLFSHENRPDRGLLLLMFLNLVVLEPWQGLFFGAGVPHAYLEGSALEVMASSDNVLRGGLTGKHVDVPELLRILRFDSAAPFLIRSSEADETRFVYRTPALEFELERHAVQSGTRFAGAARGPELLLFVASEPEARLELRSGERALELSRSESCLIPDGTGYELSATGRGNVVRVTIPEPTVPSFRGRTPTELAFGTSGLRGLVTDITDLEAYVNARGFLDYLFELGELGPGGQVVLGGDLRPSTDTIARAVARAAQDLGLSLINAGKLPTPALALYALEKRLPAVMVTGSHIPFDRNGIKFYRPIGEVTKQDETPILRAVANARRSEYLRDAASSIFDDSGMLREGQAPELPTVNDEAREGYVARYLGFFGTEALQGLRVVVYQHSAVGRDLLAELLEKLGAVVHPMGRTETFVPIDTEAISDEKLDELQELANEAERRFGAIDAIVSTDGDSDRPLVLGVDQDRRVRFIPGDVLCLLVCDALKVDAIAVPVSATDAIDRFFDGKLSVSRTKIGSPWVIAAMSKLEGDRRVGFEANGGFLVGSELVSGDRRLAPLPTRDAVLPIVAVLSLSKERLTSLPKLLEALPQRFGRSGLIDVEPEALKALSRQYDLKDPSVTRVRFEGSQTFVTNAEGEWEAHGTLLLRAAGLRAALSRQFRSDLGFSEPRSIDFTDGIRIGFDNGEIAHVRGSGNAPQLRIYALADSESRAQEIAAACLRKPDGVLSSLLEDARAREFLAAVQHNVTATEALFSEGAPSALLGTVSGSPAAQRFWQHALDRVKEPFRARAVESFCEDLPVNQAFGLLLLWQRLRPKFEAGSGALVAFVFGEGTRSTPFTETDNGQKPAIRSFAALGPGKPRLSMVELALRYFAPVEAFLRRSGFDGVVVKWGDEVQIPTRSLSGTDPLFDGADVVRFVSRRAMTDDEARNKDWVGFDADGKITTFVPRRPLERMHALAERGLLEKRGDTLYGGINLGSIAVSRVLLDALLAEFESEVLDPKAQRSRRPDLDPQFFTALTLAAIRDPEARAEAWRAACSEIPKLVEMEQNLPGVFERLTGVLERFEADRGRPAKFVVLDFVDQYWGDVGQHRQIYDFYMALAARSAEGSIARALAGLGERRDRQGNILAGDTQLGSDVRIENSVLIDCEIQAGHIQDSVLIGTRARSVRADRAFDVESVVDELVLAARAGSYKVVSPEPVVVAAGERVTTLFLPTGEVHLLRVHEDTDLRDKAANYDVPILGNALSFREAHERMSSGEAEQLFERRQKAVAGVLARRS